MRRSLLPLLILAVSTAAAAQESPHGTLSGRVVDAATKRPVPGISVAVLETARRAATAEDGSYSLAGMPVGEYRVLVEGGGYQPLVQPDVVVRSARITFLNVELHRIVVSESVTVSSPYFPEQRTQPVSQARLGAEEIRRAPGSANDISRALYALPGITQSEDMANDLAVRGGSPFENAFLIDGIPVLNINHFPQLGASGGNITMLNVDFVEVVDASTGGFGAENGNALSSVFELRLRDGNRQRSEGQLDLNMAGFGGTYEGPLGRNASWMLSAKRSFLDLLGDSVGSTTESTWTDVNAKLGWDLGQRHRLSFLSIDGDSRSRRSLEAARERGSSPGSERFRQSVNGVSWRAFWGSRALSETSVAHNGQRVNERWTSAWGPEVWEDYTYSDDVFTVRNVNQIELGPSYSLKAGLEGSHREASYRDRTGQFGTRALSGSSAAAHLSQMWRPWGRLSTVLGVRVERFAFPDTTYWSPRLSASWLVGRRTTVNASFGRYRQQLPPYLIGQDDANQSLEAPSVTHAIAGFRFNPSERTLVSIEGYRKDYEHFPLSPRAPLAFVIDDVHGDTDNFGVYGALLDGGKAKASGVDFLFQLKPTPRLYGTVSASLSRDRYRDLAGTWRSRFFDNRYVFSLVAGYKAGRAWELGGRFLVAGGKAHTPIDVEASRARGGMVLDAARVMGAHYPAYHSLSLRVDRRFYFRRTNLAAYLSVWNAYNHTNVLSYSWNARAGAVATEKQWSILPVVGVELEF